MGYSEQVQEIVFNALNGVISADVYDYFPQQDDSGSAVEFPFVTIGDDILEPWDTMSDTGIQATVTVHVWSKYEGKKEVKDIQDEIYNALHRQILAVGTGYNFVGCDLDDSRVIIEGDGVTIHGTQDFIITLDEG